MKRKANTISSIDWISVLFYLFFVIFGWLNIYSAVYNEEHHSIFSFSERYGRQLILIIVALFLAVTIFLINSRFYSLFAYTIYSSLVALLLVVLIFGSEVKGAKSWFMIAGMGFQPAEFAKIATNLALAQILSSPNFHLRKIKSYVYPGLIILVPMSLIILQNDTGSALVFSTFIFVLYREGMPGAVLWLGIAFVVLFIMALMVQLQFSILLILIVAAIINGLIQRSGLLISKTILLFTGITGIIFIISKALNHPLGWSKLLIISFVLQLPYYIYWAFFKRAKYLYGILGIAVIAIFFTFSIDYIFYNVLETHQRTRINILLGIEEDPHGAGYNVKQSKIAIGSGGVYGKGFMQGTQTKYDFVPEQSTDFIFCTIGEEWGFLGSSAIIILYLLFISRLILIAERQNAAFSRVFGYGVASIFFFHFAVNIGMTIGLAPVIGIPLPFFSYGGSSLWAFTILLFVFLKLDASRDEYYSG